MAVSQTLLFATRPWSVLPCSGGCGQDAYTQLLLSARHCSGAVGPASCLQLCRRATWHPSPMPAYLQSCRTAVWSVLSAQKVLPILCVYKLQLLI
jgi:hypothetical protein